MRIKWNNEQSLLTKCEARSRSRVNANPVSTFPPPTRCPLTNQTLNLFIVISLSLRSDPPLATQGTTSFYSEILSTYGHLHILTTHPRAVALTLPNALDLEHNSSCYFPNHEIMSQLLPNYNFAAAMSRHVNIWYAGSLIFDSQSSLWPTGWEPLP